MALWGLLALASTVTTVLAEDPGGVRTLNLRFGYGFFVSDATNQTLMPEGEPTDAQISAVMCQTQYWLSKVFQDLNDAPFLTVKATNIDWMRGPIDATGTDLFEITFAAELNSLDGSPIPPEEEIIATIENPSVQVNRTQEYILNYVYSADPRDDSPNWFANVDAISFNGEFGTPTGTGRLGEADCEETLAPTPSKLCCIFWSRPW